MLSISRSASIGRTCWGWVQEESETVAPLTSTFSSQSFGTGCFSVVQTVRPVFASTMSCSNLHHRKTHDPSEITRIASKQRATGEHCRSGTLSRTLSPCCLRTKAARRADRPERSRVTSFLSASLRTRFGPKGPKIQTLIVTALYGKIFLVGDPLS